MRILGISFTFLCLCLLVACGGGGSDNDGPNYTDVSGGNSNDVFTGEEWYAQLCADCHGVDGNGNIAIIDALARDDLVSYIASSMPIGNVDACDQTCAEKVAEWMVDNFDIPDDTGEDLAEDGDIQAIMSLAKVNCTSCHDDTPGTAKVNLLTGSDSELANRLVDVESSNDNCAGEKLIDSAVPENSLLLKLIIPNSDEQCMSKMPLGADGIPAEYLEDFRKWVDELIAAKEPDDGKDDDETSTGLVELDPLTFARKAKLILHGGALTDQELSKISTTDGQLDKAGIGELVTQWTQQASYQSKLFQFLQMTLQQDAETIYRPQLNRIRNGSLGRLARDSFNQSFAKTALKIIAENRDFREIVTTNTWEVNTMVLAAVAWADSDERRRRLENDERVEFLNTMPFTQSDASDWRTVTLNHVGPPSSYKGLTTTSRGTEILSSLRAIPDGGSINLAAPRFGFFNTPAFIEKWSTNVDNQFRVNTNQTLLVALGLTFQSGDTTMPEHLEGVPAEHAEQGTDCFGCHKNMDTMRNVLRNAYSESSLKLRDNSDSVPADFAFRGHKRSISTVQDFANAIASHPHLAMGWTLRFCEWVNGIECDRNDPAIASVAKKFADSGFKFNTMVKELFMSSAVTQTTFDDTLTASGLISARSKRHFCHALEVRASAIKVKNNLTSFNENICNASRKTRDAANILPQISFSRGDVALTQSPDHSMMVDIGFDKLCQQIAEKTTPGGSQEKLFDYRTEDSVSRSIEDLTELFLGLPPSTDAYANTYAMLRKIYNFGRATPVCDSPESINESLSSDSPTCGLSEGLAVSLRLTIRTACQSPYFTNIGY